MRSPGRRSSNPLPPFVLGPLLAAAAIGLAAGCSSSPAASAIAAINDSDPGAAGSTNAAYGPDQIQLPYNGGAVMSGQKNVYVVWYGKWDRSTNPTVSIVEDFLGNLGGSPYFKINETFYDNGSHIDTNAVAFGGSVTIGYTKGTSLSEDDVANIVEDQIDAHRFPADANGIYFVLGDPFVQQTLPDGSAMCTGFCGWHDHESYAGIGMKFGYAGSNLQCAKPGCTWTSPAGPNGPEVDALVSTIAHEIIESSNDPLLDAWHFGNLGATNPLSGQESADLCNWSTGETYAAGAGQANVHLGGTDYLLSQQWVNTLSGGCDTRLGLARPYAAVGRKTADFDGDGWGELLLHDASDDSVWLWPLFGTQPVGNYHVNTPTNRWQIYGIADMNGDKKADIVWRNTLTRDVSVWFMNGHTIASSQTTTPGQTAIVQSMELAGIADLDGDGHSELLFRFPNAAASMMAMTFANGSVTLATLANMPPSTLIAGTGDFDGDGRADILWDDQAGTYTAWFMVGTKSKGSAVLVASKTARVIGIADLDGDLTHDLVLREGASTVTAIFVKAGKPQPPKPLPSMGTTFRLEAAVDTRDDGSDDLLWRNRQTGDVELAFSTTGTGAVAAPIFLSSSPTRSMELIRD